MITAVVEEQPALPRMPEPQNDEKVEDCLDGQKPIEVAGGPTQGDPDPVYTPPNPPPGNR